MYITKLIGMLLKKSFAESALLGNRQKREFILSSRIIYNRCVSHLRFYFHCFYFIYKKEIPVSTVKCNLVNIIVVYVIYGWIIPINPFTVTNVECVELGAEKISPIVPIAASAWTKKCLIIINVKVENIWQNARFVMKTCINHVENVTNYHVGITFIGNATVIFQLMTYVVQYVRKQCSRTKIEWSFGKSCSSKLISNHYHQNLQKLSMYFVTIVSNVVGIKVGILQECHV